jgi:hypothetical protein
MAGGTKPELEMCFQADYQFTFCFFTQSFSVGTHTFDQYRFLNQANLLAALENQ